MELLTILTEKENGYNIMALDWYILEHAIPSIHVFTWNPPAISIGYLQQPLSLNIEEIRKRNMIVVRRPTGGKAVVHIGDISLAMFLPRSLLPQRAKDAYIEMSDLLREALFIITNLPLSRTKQEQYHTHEGCFSSSTGYEIGINGEKIAGIAVRKTRSGMLMHASIRMTPFPSFANNLFLPPEHMKGTSFSNFNKSFSPSQLLETLTHVVTQAYHLQATSWNINITQLRDQYQNQVAAIEAAT